MTQFEVAQDTYAIEELGAVDFPMLRAFHTLNLSTSNSAQSAPSSAARYTQQHWSELENHLKMIPAIEFVTLAIPDGSAMSEDLENQPQFKEWMLTYV